MFNGRWPEVSSLAETVFSDAASALAEAGAATVVVLTAAAPAVPLAAPADGPPASTRMLALHLWTREVFLFAAMTPTARLAACPVRPAALVRQR